MAYATLNQYKSGRVPVDTKTPLPHICLLSPPPPCLASYWSVCNPPLTSWLLIDCISMNSGQSWSGVTSHGYNHISNCLGGLDGCFDFQSVTSSLKTCDNIEYRNLTILGVMVIVYKLDTFGRVGSILTCSSIHLGCLVPVDWWWFMKFLNH